MDTHQKEIIWQAPEFQYREKDVAWYWLSILAALFLILLSLWQKNLLFALFIVVAETMLIIWAKQFPKIIQFKIDKTGIYIGEMKSYDYEDLAGFHISQKHDETGELILKTKNKLHPYVKILLLNKDIPKIKSALQNHLPEIEYEESLIDHFGKMIGF